MDYTKLVVSRVPRASRSFQSSILQSVERRFEQLVQSVCATEKQMMQHLCTSKELLLDIRHILVYQSFDHDIRNRMMTRAEGILAYINAFMNTMGQEYPQRMRLAS